MMGFLRRLFSSEYRKALAAEATGDYLSAARSYALCGEEAKVADMHLARARGESTRQGKIRALRSALDFAPPGDPRSSFICRSLADQISALAADMDSDSPAAREHRAEAAKLLERGEAWEDAGECYLAQGDVDSATRAFGRAGLLDRVEQILGDREAAQQSDRVSQQSFADYRLAMQEGSACRALTALQRCVAHAADKGHYRRLEADLRERMLTRGRVELRWRDSAIRIISALPATLGRDPDCDVPLRGPSVSRDHARIHFQKEAERFEVADADSRNGTFLDGLRIGQRLALVDGATLRIGDEGPLLTVTLVTDSRRAVLLQVKEGVERGKRFALCVDPVDLPQLVPDAPPFRISFREGIPLLRPLVATSLLLNGVRAAARVEPLRGDVLTIDDVAVEVS